MSTTLAVCGGMRTAVTLLRDGQPFHRCAVAGIDSIACAPGSSEEVGRVTAVYGKTRAGGGGPWVYGWTIHSHRAKNADGTLGPRTYHVASCPASGC